MTEWVDIKFGASISQMTMGRILNKNASLTTFDVGHLGDSKRIRKVQCSEKELATYNWVTTMQENGATMFDDLVIATTKRFNALRLSDPSAKEL